MRRQGTWKSLAGGLIGALALSGCATDAGSALQSAPQQWDGTYADNTTRFEARLLTLHNTERASLGLAGLTWNATLAAHARSYAQDLARRGAFEHSPAASRPGEGENLWKGTAGAYTLEEMIGHFLGEKSDFKPGVFPEVTRSGPWEGVAHYTQIIWPTTREVGCALARNGNTDWLVCRYAPLGNVVGQKVG